MPEDRRRTGARDNSSSTSGRTSCTSTDSRSGDVLTVAHNVRSSQFWEREGRGSPPGDSPAAAVVVGPLARRDPAMARAATGGPQRCGVERAPARTQSQYNAASGRARRACPARGARDKRCECSAPPLAPRRRRNGDQLMSGVHSTLPAVQQVGPPCPLPTIEAWRAGGLFTDLFSAGQMQQRAADEARERRRKDWWVSVAERRRRRARTQAHGTATLHVSAVPGGAT